MAYAFHFWRSMNFRIFIVELSCKHAFWLTSVCRLNLKYNHQLSITWYLPSLSWRWRFFISRSPSWVSRLRWHDWCTIYLLTIHVKRPNYGYWRSSTLSWTKETTSTMNFGVLSLPFKCVGGQASERSYHQIGLGLCGYRWWNSCTFSGALVRFPVGSHVHSLIS